MVENGITAVIFDWDMTLAYSISPQATFVDRLAQIFSQHSVNATKTEIIAAMHHLQEDIKQGRINAALHPQKKREIVRSYQLILRYLNFSDTSYAFAYRLYSSYAELPHFLYDDVLPTLEKLKERGLMIGIISNHSKSMRPTIEQFLDGYTSPHHITISEEVGVHKPGKTIFRRGIAKLHVKPAQCVYIGDNLQIDAIGAVQVGKMAQGVWIDRRNEHISQSLPPHVVRITTLGAMLDLI